VNIKTSKNQLRRHLREARAALSPQQQACAATQLATRLVTSPLLRSGRRIACYLSSDGEIDPRPLIERLWKMKRECYLPVLSRLSHDRLWFARVMPDTRLARNRFGIPEPMVRAGDLLRAQEMDIILLPLVGFDPDGNRLGMGGGFYDRSLAFLRHRRCWKKPRLVGLAHACQEIAALSPSPWDVPLDAIATDEAIHLVD
jgi:5-formyltetrahydrofolate cyclo-ligase